MDVNINALHCCCKIIPLGAECLVGISGVDVAQDSAMKNFTLTEHVTAFSTIELLCKQSYCLQGGL